MYKVIVSDLDGTLLRNDKTVSKFTIATFKKYKKLGYKIILATARPPRDILKHIPSNLKHDMIICYNGALIIEKKNILYKKELNKKIILKIINLAIKYKETNICIEINDKLYSNFPVETFFGKGEYFYTNLTTLDYQSASKIIICNMKGVNPHFAKMLPIESKGVLTDNGTLCQIMNSEVNKWESIKFLLKKFNYSHKKVIAFGNDFNDTEMIKNCGLGIAVDNAVDDLKKYAKFITKNNDTDGVAVFLENLENNISQFS